MRNLVHIEKIKLIEPINGADNIELVKLLDWQCVAKKGEFKVGDLAVYHEIDSICPDREEYEFLRARKFRVKTARMLQVLSQGLVLPLSILPVGKYKEGEDVTSLCGVTHYDPDSRLNVAKPTKKKSKFVMFLLQFWFIRKFLLPILNFNKHDKGNWPDFIEHTDEENIQAIFSKVKREYGDATFYVTEKIDYQSATFFTRMVTKFVFGFPLKHKMFSVCSRTQWKKTDDDSLWWLNAKKFNIENILRDYPEELTIQCESGDTKVQGNKYKLKDNSLWLFNIISNRTGYHFDLSQMEDFCSKNNLNMVPVLDREFKLPETVTELIEYSRGNSIINNSVIREGIVIRLIKDGKKLVSFKVKNPDFLIKHKE